ncbi:MAG: septum formation initiator family protein [Verrucomicrobiota bacterium]
MTKAVIALVVVAIMILFGFRYLPLIQQNERMRKEIFRLDAEIQKQAELSRQLQAEIAALRNDPKTVERLMRGTLGYAKQDETVIRFETGASNASAR